MRCNLNWLNITVNFDLVKHILLHHKYCQSSSDIFTPPPQKKNSLSSVEAREALLACTKNIGRNSRFFGHYVSKTNKNTEKKYSKIQGQLKLYQTVYFLSRNSKYKVRKSDVLWPLLFVCFPLTSHHIIGSSVSMSVKYILWRWYGTLLSDIPII